MSEITESTYMSYKALKNEMAMFINDSKLNESTIKLIKNGVVGAGLIPLFFKKSASALTHLFKIIGFGKMAFAIPVAITVIPVIEFAFNIYEFNDFKKNIKEKHQEFVELIIQLKGAIKENKLKDKTLLFKRAVLMKKCLKSFIKD